MNKIFTLLFFVFAFNLQAQDFEEPADYFASSNFDDEVNYEIFDYDGDGDMDIVGGKDATIYLNDGSNNFDTEIFLSFREYRAKGDFNGDGLMDFVSTDDLIINNGDGTFTSSSLDRDDFHITGDFNNDGRDDLVTWEISSERKFYLSFGNEDGTLSNPELITMAIFGFQDAQATAGDFNGDGNLDLAISTATNTLGIYLNDGTGSFTGEDYEVEEMYFHLQTSDLDQDGDLDLVWGFQSSKIGWILNENGTFGPSQFEWIETTGSFNSSGIAVKDFDADGFPDIFVTGNAAFAGFNGNRFLKNEGGEGFADVVLLTTIPNPGFWDYDNYTRTTAFDYEGDGDMDVAVHGEDTIKVFINNAGPSPTAAFSFINNSVLEISFTNESIGDFTESLWDFGDGNTSTEMSPTHTYAVGGDYEVCLTMTGVESTLTTCQAVNLLTSVESSYLSGISVYPNPFIRSIQVDAEELRGTQIQANLTDMTGKILLTKSGILPMTVELDRELAKGNYLLTITTPEDENAIFTEQVFHLK